jgi:dTDP-4-amino-4,6-dideoxygalactose transaminase
MLRELPPTAGLPLQWRDFLPAFDAPNFEAMLADFIGVPAVQIESSGTACLVLALESLKRLSSRRTVVIPAYTCPLVPLAIAHVGLRVRLCDTRPDRFDFDTEALAAACDSDTLCVMPTHLGGSAADLAPVLEIARGVGAYVIEDAAQSLGATWRGRQVGTIGDIGFYSLARGKGLTLYEGGLLVARAPELRALLKKTSDELISSEPIFELLRLIQLFGYRLGYHPVGLSLSYGLPLRFWLKRGNPARAVGDEVSPVIALHRVGAWRKRIGAAALKRLAEFQMENRRRGRQRAEECSRICGLRIMGELPESCGTWPFLMVVFDMEESCARALSRLWRSGLGVTRLFVHPLAGYRLLKTIVPESATPNARSLAARCLTISNSSWVSDTDFRRIRDTLAEVIRCM